MALGLLKDFDSVIVASLQQNNLQTIEHTAGIILAAGESTRYGDLKQLLDWRGKPFVRKVAETALQAGLWPVVVVTGFRATDVESCLTNLPVSITRNEEYTHGQSTSIQAGIRSLPKNVGASVFLLADQPQIPVEVIRALTESHSRELQSILAPRVLEERRANPVLFDRVTFDDLLTLKGDVGGRGIFDKHRVEYLPWHDDRLLFDVDKPEDYKRLVEDESL
jgi:molybdenum cofactor cytidylyltransferase